MVCRHQIEKFYFGAHDLSAFNDADGKGQKGAALRPFPSVLAAAD